MLAVKRIDTPEDDGAAESGPLRRCIASGTSLPIAQLIRFVVDPEGKIVPDVDGSLPGRGLWLSADRDMIDKAVSKGLFAKAARGNVKAGADLADRVEDLLRRRCLNHLGLSRRAGLVAAGAEKVRAQISTGRTAVLIEASDGSPQESRKISALAPNALIVSAFTGAELGAALGRDSVVHVALLPGALTETLLRDASRYEGVRREN
jgi:predicted RNA-binding protein YlxR (DUF448 family)